MSSKATGPIVTKFHIEPPWAEGGKVCSNNPGHMINMAAMPSHGKKPLQIFRSQTSELIALKFDM